MKSATRQRIRVCQVVDSVSERTGGPAVSVPALADGLAGAGLKSSLFCLNSPCWGRALYPLRAHSYVVPAGPIARKARGFSMRAQKLLAQLALSRLDIIHAHGLWMFHTVNARKSAGQANLPLIVSPRGMLEPWTLQFHGWRKRLAWKLYEQENLLAARAFHATSEGELNSIRECGFHQPCAVIPNGVSVPDSPGSVARSVLEVKYPVLREKKWIVFLSRLHPKKGVSELLRVWGELSRQHPGWMLVIAGPPAPGLETRFPGEARQLGLERRVLFPGAVSGAEKQALLAHAEFSVLPTHSENFGIVVAESLAHGTPVITTREAPWRDLETYGCGWWIEDSEGALHQAAIQALSMSVEERGAMGIRGRDMVRARYSWEDVAARMAKFYEWILRGGQRPAHVDGGR